MILNLKDDEFSEDESQMETEDDIGELGQTNFSEAVVSGNDWTTETVISQINKGNIKLNPSFQRRDAWDKDRKSKFIESLILGLPVPQIVLAESKEKRGSYIVLDGKQRLLSIRQFSEDTGNLTYEQLKLTSLEIRKDLKGKSLEDLRNDPTFADDLSAFENQPIRTVVIKNWPNEDFLYHVFLRLNTGSVPLSPQELRQALHPGPFIKFLDESSCESEALRNILNLKKPDFRMRDTELLLRYFAFKLFLNEYKGSLKLFLDECCSKLNSEWMQRHEEIESLLFSFELAHQSIKEIFGEDAYRKWNGNGYESRFNRSVFDVMVFSFSEKHVRDLSKGKGAEIVDGFIRLCVENRAFRSSIESTTKSLGATHSRLSLWNIKLNEIIGAQLHIHELIDNRIV